MQFARYYHLFCAKHNCLGKVNLIRASEDPGTAAYMGTLGISGATDMDEHGNIYIKINDTGPAGKATWLEEIYHSFQFLRDGNIELSCNHEQRAEREIETNECLLRRSKRLKLSESEIANCQWQIEYYGKYL